MNEWSEEYEKKKQRTTGQRNNVYYDLKKVFPLCLHFLFAARVFCLHSLSAITLQMIHKVFRNTRSSSNNNNNIKCEKSRKWRKNDQTKAKRTWWFVFSLCFVDRKTVTPVGSFCRWNKWNVNNSDCNIVRWTMASFLSRSFPFLSKR